MTGGRDLSDGHRAVGHLGPDLLGPDWNPERALTNLLADPARPLGEALLDQRNLAGIGNVWNPAAGSVAPYALPTVISGIRRDESAELVRQFLHRHPQSPFASWARTLL